ncbi:hypothetical protein P20495_4003 [Pseudoalteromonas sp. BSi20495]|nr:hypothetical protein P20495_4003 [Pseudoalteromonas sp. BSi20495]
MVCLVKLIASVTLTRTAKRHKASEAKNFAKKSQFKVNWPKLLKQQKLQGNTGDKLHTN